MAASNTLYNWATSVSGLPVIWANGNAPQPRPPYVVLNIINSGKIGRASTSPPNASGKAQKIIQKEFTLSVQVIGYKDLKGFPYVLTFDLDVENNPLDAMDLADKIKDSLELDSVRGYLFSKGLAIRNIGNVINTPTVINRDFRPRSIFDIVFGKATSQTDDTGLIESFSGSGDIKIGNFDKKINF